MLGGIGCEETEIVKLRDCAYPMRLKVMLDYLVSSDKLDPFLFDPSSAISTKIRVINLARGATDTVSVLPSLPILFPLNQLKESLPSAIFIDFSVNDVTSNEQSIKLGTEALFRFLKFHPNLKNVPIFMIESLCADKGDHSFLSHLELAQFYDIPLFSHRSIIENSCHLKDIWGAVKGGMIKPHPPWRVHRNVAFSILQGLLSVIFDDPCYFGKKKSVKLSLHPSQSNFQSNSNTNFFNSRDLLDPYLVCEPLSFYEASEFFYYTHERQRKRAHHQMIISSSNNKINLTNFDGISFSNVGDSLWRLVEDRRGKAGWVNSNLNNNSSIDSSSSYIEFDILLSTTSPRVIIGYMKGYELLGKVKVSFPLHPDLLKDYSSQLRSIVLDGIDPTMKFKATQTHPISIKPSMDSYLNHETLSQNSKVLKTKLRITSLPTNGENQKFKIVFVISC